MVQAGGKSWKKTENGGRAVVPRVDVVCGRALLETPNNQQVRWCRGGICRICKCNVEPVYTVGRPRKLWWESYHRNITLPMVACRCRARSGCQQDTTSVDSTHRTTFTGGGLPSGNSPLHRCTRLFLCGLSRGVLGTHVVVHRRSWRKKATPLASDMVLNIVCNLLPPICAFRHTTGLTKRQPASGAKTASPMGIRQSPRLVRKRPGGAANEGDGVTKTKISASRTKRSLSSSAANFANASKRRQVTAPGEDIPRPRAGVLVDETPQKRSGDVAMRTGRRGGRAARAPQDDSPAPQAALPPAEVADRKCSMRISVRGQIHGSPAAPMGSPTTGPVTRRRAMDSASPDVGATTRTRRMPSPACWRAAPAASRLFVAESPGVSMGVKRGRSMWPAGDSSGDRDGIALQLATESASPVPRRRAVVPDTPA